MTKKEYLESTDRCELCGSPKKLEIHHIIPLCAGGEDSLNNWICICGCCHSKLTPKSLLSKAGINRTKAQNVLIEIYNEFYKRIGEMCESEGFVDAVDCMDIFDEVYMPRANKICSLIKNPRNKYDYIFENVKCS